MGKMIAFKKETRMKVSEGITLLANAVKKTVGPKGRHVLIKEEGGVVLTKEGSLIATSIILKDRFQNLGISVIKEALSKLSKRAGGGTKTAIILTEALFKEGLKAVINGHDSLLIKKGFDEGLKLILKELDLKKVAVTSPDEIFKVAMVAAHRDSRIGNVIKEALELVGVEGVIDVAVGKEKGIKTIFREGLSFPQGYLSPYFITQPDKMISELEEPYIFILEGKLSSALDVVPILELISQEKQKPLLVIADEVEKEALTTLVLNRLKGGINVAAVKAPLFGDQRKEFLEDLALLSNGKVFQKGRPATLNELGRAKFASLGKETTTIVGGVVEMPQLLRKISEIKLKISHANSEYEISCLKNRLARLTGGTIRIEVGEEREKERLESGLRAANSALKGGMIVGGGLSYVRASNALDCLNTSHGAILLKDALSKPLKALMESVGEGKGLLFQKVMEGGDNLGFNLVTSEIEDLFESGVIDPLIIVKEALINAVSLAGMLLTVEVMVVSN